MAYHENGELAAAVVRLINSLGRRLATDDPCELTNLSTIEAAVKEALLVAVTGMREAGHSDQTIGREFGVTKQAIQQRFPRGV